MDKKIIRNSREILSSTQAPLLPQGQGCCWEDTLQRLFPAPPGIKVWVAEPVPPAGPSEPLPLLSPARHTTRKTSLGVRKAGMDRGCYISAEKEATCSPGMSVSTTGQARNPSQLCLSHDTRCSDCSPLRLTSIFTTKKDEPTLGSWAYFPGDNSRYVVKFVALSVVNWLNLLFTGSITLYEAEFPQKMFVEMFVIPGKDFR